MSKTGLFLVAAAVLAVLELIPGVTRTPVSENRLCAPATGAIARLDKPLRVSSPGAARTLADSSALELRRAMTVEGWINIDESSRPWRRIVGKRVDGSTDESTWVFGIGSRGGLYFGLFKDDAQHFINGTRLVTPGSWHHVAATWDGSTMNTWLDGEPDQRLRFEGLMQWSSQPVRIGSGDTAQYVLEGTLRSQITHSEVVRSHHGPTAGRTDQRAKKSLTASRN